MAISKSTCLLLHTAMGGCYYCLEISEKWDSNHKHLILDHSFSCMWKIGSTRYYKMHIVFSMSSLEGFIPLNSPNRNMCFDLNTKSWEYLHKRSI